MKKIFYLFLLAIPIISNAESENKMIDPFPNTKPGINIIPASEINFPEKIKNYIEKNKKSIMLKGFNETNMRNQEINSLLNIEKTSIEEIKQWDNNPNPYDTHLKSSPLKLKLSFNFNGVPIDDKNQIIGFAAAGGYKNGWDGIVEFFNQPKLGVCSYTTYKIDRVIFDRETIQYLVNKKPSGTNVSGNWNTGFLYTINWYTNTRLMKLQCANKMYDKSIMEKAIDLANKIDKANPND